MKTSIDTNILISIWSSEPSAPAILRALETAQREGLLVLSPIVFVEAQAHPVYGPAAVQAFLADTGIVTDLQMMKASWTEAAHRFASYAERRRRSGGKQPRRIAADFLVGAHALMQADRLITMDTSFYEVNYPELNLIAMTA